MRGLITRDNLVAGGVATPLEPGIRPPVIIRPKIRPPIRSKRRVGHITSKLDRGGATSSSMLTLHLAKSNMTASPRSSNEIESDDRSGEKNEENEHVKDSSDSEPSEFLPDLEIIGSSSSDGSDAEECQNAALAVVERLAQDQRKRRDLSSWVLPGEGTPSSSYQHLTMHPAARTLPTVTEEDLFSSFSKKSVALVSEILAFAPMVPEIANKCQDL